MPVLKYWDGSAYVPLSVTVGTGSGAVNLDDLTDVQITSPASTQVLSYNGTQWVNAPAPVGGGGGGGGVGASGRFLIATPDASTTIKDAADLVLTAGAGIAAALQGALNANSRVLILGPTITLDASVDVTSGVDVLSEGTRIIGHAALDSWAGGTSRLSIFKVQGSETNSLTNPFSANQTKGSRTLTFNTPHGFALGDYIRIRSNEVRNVNRSYYFKGELNRVIKVVSTTVIEVETPLRDTYTVSGFTINTFKMNLLSNVKLEGLVFQCNDSAVKRQEMVTLQWCLNPKIVNCQAFGGANKRAGQGFSLSKCIGGHIDNCYVYDILDNYPIGDSSVTDNSRNGYGFYVGGCESVVVSNCFANHCRHGYDVNNYGASSWPVSRYTTFENCVGYQTAQPPFTTHDSEFTTYINCNAIGSAGGFHLRGEDFALTDCSVIEPTNQYHAEYAAISNQMNNGNNDTHGGLQIGETDYTANAQGLAGMRLNVKNMRIDNNNPLYKMCGMYSRDPIKDANIEIVMTPTSRGVFLQGDYVENTKFNITVHGDMQNSSTRTGIEFVPQITSTTASQYFSNNTINLYTDKVKGSAIEIAGGVRGGVSKNNVINLTVAALAPGVSSSAPQVKFTSGTHGRYFFDKIFADSTYEGAFVDNGGGATIVKGPLSAYKVLVLQNWPIVANVSSAFEATTTSSVITVPTPNGYQDGDYLLAVWVSAAGSTVPNSSALIPASGFSQVGPAQIFANDSYRFTQFYGKSVTGAQPSNLTWEFTPNATFDAFRHGIIVLLLRGHAPLTITGSGAITTVPNPPSTVNFATFNTSTNNSMVFSVAHVTVGAGVDGTVTTPTGYSQEYSLLISNDPPTLSSEYVQIFSKPIVTAGSVAAVTSPIAEAGIQDATISIALAG